ncbi:DUF3570 domain-containing protein [Alteromonas sp. ASW11-36]|uniref:DUF3570 domain-containing protein n=1 Tax=Alteromonas arenosi TaxID=3055817 RepID=A0ABT7T1C3_9ALTE|nr:DUF3570 domain-containing protein [Alteromonas sp. ASW11-36]MDM7862024.1 DUF3570 domain-containing protein [Alteromonas sp. ASW11-36]
MANCRLFITGVLLLLSTSSWAAVLPEDRSDVMYHYYSGDGVTIDGPSILLRKKIGNRVSLSANYYLDTVSGASIDVRATASPYVEEREETTLGADFLHNKTLVSMSYTNSSENDFEASSAYIGISQDFFGDLTNISLSYAKGWDEVGRRGDENFLEEADRNKYGIGITQIVTKSMIVGFSAEHISDEGYLNNPYRSVRFLDDSAARGFSFATEIYPETRSSNAVSLNANYYLPYRAAIYADVRWYNDTWGITASNGKLGYIHTIGDDWIIDVYARYYSQESADFYQDLFGRPNEFNFMARDKEMSTYSNFTAGISVAYEWQFSASAMIKKSSIQFEYDYMQFDYDNFRDVTADAPVGEEPLFGFSANVIKVYASIWY